MCVHVSIPLLASDPPLQIKPPFDPRVESEFDLRNFDPEFVNEPVPSPNKAGQSLNHVRWPHTPKKLCSFMHLFMHLFINFFLSQEVTLSVEMPGVFDGFSYVGDASALDRR